MLLARLTKSGVDRVLSGAEGMTFIVDSWCGVNDRCALVRDYRYASDSKPYQLWTIAPDGFELISVQTEEPGARYRAVCDMPDSRCTIDSTRFDALAGMVAELKNRNPSGRSYAQSFLHGRWFDMFGDGVLS